ncbi:phosphate acetyltransferase [Sporolactobacillus terrae]|uniref:Phosphate acetyltransferase n=1 Tax=Sporolactobacillus terrae TaxID=269673 RepID=A0A410DCH0_9BACL|nr:phosphate acetyltransferase [Sporolactobacillus terrae]QAA23711.1 phosphate acetyltransferase [Sporolactobacillus terrae]QAA26682.1 phosphate acetyltransferase [Sporolactobacillus terrae]UAK15750.1 phosphate acetyltransferase [Sporolactobacillus terrae]BBO00239.1 phosphate acetyltransferase [Sporolactobacillus terrae]
MADLFERLKPEIKKGKPSIIFPEADDERIREAVCTLASEELIVPILIGKQEESTEELRTLASENKLRFLHPETDKELQTKIDALVARRKGKTDAAQAAQWLSDPCYYGTMLVYLGEAEGLVSGAAHSTAETVRPALQIIKAQPGKKRISGSFILTKGDKEFVFADCGINISPDSETLAEIAIESAETAVLFGIDPKIAMLSFSTKGSAKDPSIDKVNEAVKRVHEKAPDLAVDGELQFDAAYVPEVAAKKAPDSPIAGKATVFVFPNIDAGNIGYKMVQRLGGYTAVGPILQGLAKPVNDLSRGCSADDVYKLALITAKQALSAAQPQNV